MAHFRRPTFNSLNNHIPNLNRLTLASHNKTSRSSSLSPSESPSIPNSLPTQSRPDDQDNDFQSNARVWTTSFSGSHFAGLGITFPRHPQSYTKADLDEPKSTLLDSTTQPLSQVKVLHGQLGDEPVPLQDDFSRLYEPQLSPSWSLSSMSGLTESTCPLSQGATLQYPDSDTQTAMTFSSIAAASGMPLDLLAEQLSATADLALQYMAENSNGSFSSLGNSASRSEGSLLEELLDDRHTSWPVLPNHEGDITPGPEIKTYTGTWVEPSLAINPADTTTESLHEVDPPLDPLASSTSAVSGFAESLYSLDDFLLAAKSETGDEGHLVLPGNIATEQTEAVTDTESATHHEVFLPLNLEDNNSDYELPHHSHSSRSSSPFPSPRQRKRTWTSKGTKRKSNKPKQNIQATVETLADRSAPVKAEDPLLDLNLGTPVLDAHRGIDLEDLKSKAERYRLRNPGRKYDNSWLVSFVGKLSSRGELVKEFRCYVQGCSQSNKRRDHILIHVGSHLDQRPFACAFCPSQFLRKNECKRHELSHSGTKPYVCSICPDTAFVRQDLLRRHTLRAHGVTVARKRKGGTYKEEEKENIRVRPSKRAKRESDI